MGRLDSIFTSLQKREIIKPYLEASILSDNWPEKYTITIDSSGYYGASADGIEQGKGAYGDGYFHPSTHAVTTPYDVAAPRYLWFRFHPLYQGKAIEPPRDLQGEMTLAMGSALHGVLQAQMLQGNMVVDESDIEVEWLNKRYNGRGRLDWITTHPMEGRVPVEFKTQNSQAFEYGGLQEYWDAQLSLALDNLGYRWGILLVLESGHPYRMKEFRVEKNEKLLSEVYARWDETLTYLDMDQLPPPCCTKGSLMNQKCPFRMICDPDKR